MDVTTMSEDAVVRQFEGLVLRVGRAAHARNPYLMGEDDWLQELRMAVLNAHRCFDPGRRVKFVTYAHWAVRNAVKNVLIRATAKCRRQEGVCTVGLTGANEPTARPERDRDERIVEVWEHVEALPRAQRDALRMAYAGNGRSWTEVARDAGISPQAVQASAMRGITKIREKMCVGG